MASILDRYFRLIDRYWEVIHAPGWHLGARDELVRQMDALLAPLTKAQKQAAEERILAYSQSLYERKVG